MKKLTISIVSVSDDQVMEECLRAISEKIGPQIDYEIYVVDNANNVSGLIRDNYPKVNLIVNKSRQGFAKNHNNVIRQSSGDHVLIMNPDVLIGAGFVDNLLEAIESEKSIGIVMGKLMKSPEDAVIDSTGLVILKSRRTVDRGQGEQDRGQYDRSGEIFSASGAAMLCKREMLGDIKLFGEYFDESFLLYKEDLDLSWRARLRGWKVFYEPHAVAYHDRGWGQEKTRANIPRWIRRESYKNRYLLMIKNDHLINVLRDLPFILLHEIIALVYAIFREPHLFLAWPQIVMQLPKTLCKRAEIMKKAVVGPKEIRKWFV